VRVPESAVAGPAVLHVELESETGKTARPAELPVRLVAKE
jgi:hypothetical protein